MGGGRCGTGRPSPDVARKPLQKLPQSAFLAKAIKLAESTASRVIGKPSLAARCAGSSSPHSGPQQDRRPSKNRIAKPACTLLSDSFVVRARPGTCGNTRENAEARGRLFSLVPGCSRHSGPRKAAGTALRSFSPQIRTLTLTRARVVTFAFSQSAATVVSRAAAILVSVATEMLNSPRSIAPKPKQERSRPSVPRESFLAVVLLLRTDRIDRPSL